MTNANTGARKHRSPTSSFPCNLKIRRACVRRSPCLQTLMRVLVLTVRIKALIEPDIIW